MLRPMLNSIRNCSQLADLDCRDGTPGPVPLGDGYPPGPRLARADSDRHWSSDETATSTTDCGDELCPACGLAGEITMVRPLDRWPGQRAAVDPQRPDRAGLQVIPDASTIRQTDRDGKGTVTFLDHHVLDKGTVTF